MRLPPYPTISDDAYDALDTISSVNTAFYTICKGNIGVVAAVCKGLFDPVRQIRTEVATNALDTLFHHSRVRRAHGTQQSLFVQS